jgi:hypothetical protein
MLESFGVFVFFIYFGLVTYLIRKSNLTFDLYKLRLKLFPYWFKIIAIVLILVSVFISILIQQSFEKWKDFLAVCVNLSLFISIFSKVKNEDEFSELIRFKSFTYSFITFIALAGALGAQSLWRPDSSFILNNFFVHVLIGSSMLVSLTYFYVTLYKIKKEN